LSNHQALKILNGKKNTPAGTPLVPPDTVGTPFGMDWQFCEGEITEDKHSRYL
jgi:hypothetical protein